MSKALQATSQLYHAGETIIFKNSLTVLEVVKDIANKKSEKKRKKQKWTKKTQIKHALTYSSWKAHMYRNYLCKNSHNLHPDEQLFLLTVTNEVITMHKLRAPL